MAARTVDAPEQDWLDMRDLIRVLRLSKTSLKRLIDLGEFPQPLEPTPGTRMWLWSDVLYWRMRVELRSRLVRRERSTGSTGVHRGPTTGQEGPTEQRDAPGD